MLNIYDLAAINIQFPVFFIFLQQTNSVAIKSWWYSFEEKSLIWSEITRILRKEITEESKSLWWTQILIIFSNYCKKWMIVDLLQTTKQLIQLVAYQLHRRNGWRDCQIHHLEPQKRQPPGYKVKLVTLIEGDLKAPFSIATTPKCRGELYSFPRIAPLYPWYVPYNAEC